MKNFKKISSAIAALALAATMAAPMAMTSFVANAETTTITVTNGVDGEKFLAYKLFDVEKTEGGETTGYKYTATENTTLNQLMINVVKEIDTTATINSIDDVITWLSTEGKGDVNIRKFADKLAEAILDAGVEKDVEATVADGKISLEDGYYILLQGTASGTSDTAAIVDTVGGVDTINVKRGAPTFDKKIKDVDDSGTEAAQSDVIGQWRESADHDIGEMVEFQLIATLGDDLKYYQGDNDYTLVFHDALEDAGFGNFNAAETEFTLNVGSSTYYYKEVNEVWKWVDSTDQDVTSIHLVTPGNCNANIGDKCGKCDFEIVIDDLQSLDANLGKDSTVEVIYKAELEETANIGEDGNWNAGQLSYSRNPYWSAEGDTNETDDTQVEQVVTFTYEIDVNKTDEEGHELTGAKFALYKWDKNAGTSGDWVMVDEINGESLSTFEFKGLDAGKYKIEETKAPKGYTAGEPIEFEIRAKHTDNDNASTLDTLEIYDKTGEVVDAQFEANLRKIDSEEDKIGVYEIDIENRTGSLLPSTGGIGTTLFYLGGGAIVAVAGIMLITKKRMGKEAE